MSYMTRGGLSFSGLGEVMTVNTHVGDDRVRALQRELARLGFLDADESTFGVDGKWGPRTEGALRSAARYAGYTSTPYTRSGTTVTVPDELLALLRAAAPAPAGTTGRVATPEVILPADTRPGTSPSVDEPGWTERTLFGISVPLVVTGVGMMLVGGVALYMTMRPAERTSLPSRSSLRSTVPMSAMAANRRRRRRR